jgi:hypothetical protein
LLIVCSHLSGSACSSARGSPCGATSLLEYVLADSGLPTDGMMLRLSMVVFAMPEFALGMDSGSIEVWAFQSGVESVWVVDQR